MKHLKSEILNQYYLFNFKYLNLTIEIIGKQHLDHPNSGHIGKQYAYMNELYKLIKQMKQEKVIFAEREIIYKKYKRSYPTLIF